VRQGGLEPEIAYTISRFLYGAHGPIVISRIVTASFYCSSGGTKRFLPSPSAVRQMQFPFAMRTLLDISQIPRHEIQRSPHPHQRRRKISNINHVSPFSSSTRNPNESQPSVTQTQTTLALVPNDNPTPLARTYVGTVHSLTARSRGLLPTSYDTIEGPFHMQTGYLDSALAVQYICIPPLEMKFPGSKSKSHFLAIAYPACYERFTPGDPLRSQGQMSSLFRRQLCPRIL